MKNIFDVEKLKDANPIEVIMAEDGIVLSSRGNSLVGYHSNKHGSNSKASLIVDPVSQLYKCFNCGEGGDVITWLERNRGMTFFEACRHLAERAGIFLPEVDPQEREKYERYRHQRRAVEDFYTKAADIFHKQLTDEHYKLFLNKWGLTRQTVDKYKFGFAPATREFLCKNGFTKERLKRSGLVNKSGYDFFCGRLIFPYWRVIIRLFISLAGELTA